MGRWEIFSYCGHIEENEQATKTAIREAKEEAGIVINPKDLHFVNVTHLVSNSERIQFAFVAKKWKNQAKNNEPDKADDAGWYSLDNLPKNIDFFAKAAINCYTHKIPFEELGWNK